MDSSRVWDQWIILACSATQTFLPCRFEWLSGCKQETLVQERTLTDCCSEHVRRKTSRYQSNSFGSGPTQTLPLHNASHHRPPFTLMSAPRTCLFGVGGRFRQASGRQSSQSPCIKLKHAFDTWCMNLATNEPPSSSSCCMQLVRGMSKRGLVGSDIGGVSMKRA
jgi:hypothetical protein